MAKIRIVGDSSGYVELAAPNAAGNNTLELPSNATKLVGADTNNNIAVGTGVSVSSPATNILTLGTNNVERVRVTSNGAVGIGTTEPSVRLHLHASNTDLSTFRLSGSASNATTYDIRQGIIGVSNSGFSIRDITSSTDRLVISSSGSLGIGTNNPSSTVDILGLQANSGSTSAVTPTGTLRLAFDGGNALGDYGPSLVFSQRWWGSSTTQIATGQITGVKTLADGNFGGGLAFFTSNGSSNNLLERLRIDASGRVTMPYQPAFMVRGDESGSKAENTKFAFTSTASSGAINTRVTFDRLGNWSNDNDRFTAPVAGAYHFYFGLYRQSSTSTIFSVAPRVNNSQLTISDTFIFFTSATGETANTDDGMYGSFTLNLEANDYVELFMRGGAQTITIYNGHSFFGGHLIG